MRRRDYYWSLYYAPEKRQLNDLRTDQVEAIFEAIPERHKNDWAIWREGFQSWKPLLDFPILLVSLRRVARPADAPAPAPPVLKPKAAKSEAKVVKKNDPPPIEPKVVLEKQQLDEVIRKASAKGREETAIAPESPVTLSAPEDDDDRFGDTAESRLRAAGELDSSDSILSLADLRRDEDRDSVRFNERFEVRIVFADQMYTNFTTDISLKGMQLKEPLPKGLPRYFNVEIKDGRTVIPVVCSEVKRENDGVARLRIEVNDYVNSLKTLLMGRSIG